MSLFTLNAERDGYDAWYEFKPNPDTLALESNGQFKKAFRDDVFTMTSSGKIVPLDPNVEPSKFLVENDHKRRRVAFAPISQNTSTSSYPSEARLDDPNKILVNETFATLASYTSIDPIVFLDASSMATTAALTKLNVPSKRWICPQIDPEEFQRMRAWHHVRLGSLKSVLEMTPKIAALFADYCCTWDGNAATNPRQDLTLASRIVTNTIFVTLSTRGLTVKQRKKLSDLVQKTLGYQWACVFGPHEYSNVVTIGYDRQDFFSQ